MTQSFSPHAFPLYQECRQEIARQYKLLERIVQERAHEQTRSSSHPFPDVVGATLRTCPYYDDCAQETQMMLHGLADALERSEVEVFPEKEEGREGWEPTCFAVLDPSS